MNRIPCDLRWLSVCFAMPLILVAVAVAQTPSVEEIVARNIAARGGVEKIRAVESQRLIGTISFSPESEGAFLVEIRRPAKMRSEITIHGKRMVQVTDGKAGWVINPLAGQNDATPLDEAGLKNMHGGATAIDGPLLDYKARGNTVELIGKAEVQGKCAYKLHVMEASGIERNEFVDCESYLEVKWEGNLDAKGQVGVESFFSDYRPVHGVMFAFAIDSDSLGSFQQKIRFNRIEVNTLHDDSRFGKPAPVVEDAAPATKAVAPTAPKKN